MPPKQEIELRPAAEIEALHTQVHQTALESFVSRYAPFEGLDPALLFAEAELAIDKPKDVRSEREKALVHFQGTITAVDNAVNNGLVRSPAEAELLTDALVYGQMKPSAAIKYLRPSGAGSSKLGRALSPRELATAITVHNDFLYKDEGVTIATIARIADATGVSLDTQTASISEEDTSLIASSLETYRDAIVELPIVETDPFDGPVPGRKKILVNGTTMAERGEAGVNVMHADDTYIGPGRVAAFAMDLAGIDDPDQVEDLYHPHEDK